MPFEMAPTPIDIFGELAQPQDEQHGVDHCPECGRFSKITGFRRYYNGIFDCCTMYLHCSNHGDVEVELV